MAPTQKQVLLYITMLVSSSVKAYEANHSYHVLFQRSSSAVGSSIFTPFPITDLNSDSRLMLEIMIQGSTHGSEDQNPMQFSAQLLKGWLCDSVSVHSLSHTDILLRHELWQSWSVVRSNRTKRVDSISVPTLILKKMQIQAQFVALIPSKIGN